MQKNLRSLNRIDYEVLHRTGEKVFKEATTQLIEEMSDSEKEADAAVKEMQQKSINTTLDDHGKMVLQFESLTDDITDFVDENAVQDIVESLPDLDAAIRRIEEYRSSYRSKLREIKAVLSDAYDDTDSIHMVKLMKNYILQCKEARRRTRGAEDTEKKRVDQVRVDTFSFILSDIKRLVGDLEAVFMVEVTLLEEKNLLERSEDLAEIDKKVGSVSSRITELLSYSSADGKDEWEIRTIKKRYDDLLSSKTAYIFQIKKHISEKELNKEEIFQGSKLNIRLPRFKGYGSSIDIFSFKSKFEKICERSTPRRVMAELLKNNHLEDPAYSLVKYIDDIDEIWARLKEVYGDPRVMLNRKLEEIQKIGQLWKVKDPEKIMDGLQKVINLMKDLMSLSASHDIENELFYGDGLERIFRLLGDRRLTEWLSKTCDKKLSKKASWESVIDFVGREASILQQKKVFFGRDATSKYDEEKKAFIGNPFKLKRPADASICSICGEAGHVDTSGPSFTRVIQYYSCKKFVDMTPAERFKAVKDKGLCFQCLLPGADAKEGKHKDGSCQHDFVCKHPGHAKYRKKMHVLLCEEHKSNKENQDLLTTYKSRCILKDKNRLPTYSQEIKLSFISSPTKDVQDQSRSDAVIHFTDGGDDEATERAIYQLQRIQVDGQCYTIFYDNGCGDFVSTHDAVCKLGSRATQEHKGPVPIGGVGGIITESQHGIYATSLPLHNGEEAKFSGICLDSITSEFPKYPIDGEVEDDIKQAYRKSGGDPDSLPKLSKYVGGRIDFMIGIKYLRYHPEKVFQLPSGLTIYRSMFRNIDGGRGVIGGPHEVFTAIEKQFYLDSNHVQTFLCNQEKAYRSGYQLNPDVSLLGIKVRTRFKDNDAYVDHSSEAFLSQATAMFEETEKVGSEITYRCVKCRSCKECKNAEHIEARSIREEVEEDLIASSVTIDLENRLSMASLPLIYDPVKRLLPNKHSAMKVYTQQVKKLCKNPKDKNDVLKSERKLQDAGFVDYVRNLPEEQQKMLRDSKVQNFIPWRSVWKESSISTPCRIVFDASQITNSGYSLNNILAKGSNNMNVLQEIFIRWSMHAVAIHTDVQKMYNCVKLRQEDWCLQRYIWQEELSPDKQPEEKVIKTLIYGVVSSGNIAERCIRDTAKMFKDEFPEVNEIVQKDLYVDDCISGERNLRLARIRADELEDILNRGGFSLKGVAFSGEKPPESLSNDAETITVAGHKWYTKEDKISLNLGDMTFVKKRRGKRPEDAVVNVVPDKLTRRHCLSKVAEVFDITGKFTPVTSAMKLDLHELVLRKFQWDDVLPDNLRAIWTSNFEMIQEMKNIKYKRAIVPSDAVNLDINTIHFGDASRSLLCVAIYARFLRKNGEYSCQLVLARSRLIPDGMSQPRAELYAALVNTHSGKIVERAFSKNHKHSIKLSDSQIVLHWISNDAKPLKQWVRNRVVEIRRYTEPADWFYIDSRNMIADLGTRKGCTLADVGPDSTWVNGYDWMKLEMDKFPVKSVEEITLSSDDVDKIKNETPLVYPMKYDALLTESFAVSSKIPDEVKSVYKFSNYVIDPNRRSFQVVIRILATAIRFIRILQQRVKKDVNQEPSKSSNNQLVFHPDDVRDAENYFFLMATREVKHFQKESFYGKFTKEVDEILRYSGRILPTDNVDVVSCMSDVMKDLASTSFCVPVIDKHSPIAYSIVNDYHWNDKVVKHRGIETTLRQIQKYVFIIEGRILVKKVKSSCQRCRYLEKRTIDVSMGPISKYSMTIAPAFYISQVDLAGPFRSYSYINKRATIKIWLVIFCCTTTTATSIKVMEDYSSPSFIQAFTRLSCDVGYPKLLLVDGGSQLLTSCENTKLNFQDIQARLYRDVAVEFEVVPVGGHNMNGKVERKIREIRKSLEINIHNNRLSLLQWETVVAEIANRINDLPLALGNITSNFEFMDLITPNRLRLGRNNDRSPSWSLTVTNDAAKIIQENEKVLTTWFENWLISHVPKLMHQPKWFKMNQHVSVGDVVLFVKHDSTVSSTYQYGIIHEVEKSRDDIIRKVKVKYRNHNEDFDRLTYRAIRQLVMIHPINELNIVQEIGVIANFADYKYKTKLHDDTK